MKDELREAKVASRRAPLVGEPASLDGRTKGRTPSAPVSVPSCPASRTAHSGSACFRHSRFLIFLFLVLVVVVLLCCLCGSSRHPVLCICVCARALECTFWEWYLSPLPTPRFVVAPQLLLARRDEPATARDATLNVEQTYTNLERNEASYVGLSKGTHMTRNVPRQESKRRSNTRRFKFFDD